MDFDLDDDHQAVSRLAEQILSRMAEVQRIRDVEDNQGGFDRSLWRALADSDLLGVALPPDRGGAGLGLLGLCAVLEQQGRRVAPVPLWAVLTLGALPISQFGSEDQKARWLAGILDGSRIVTGAFDDSPGQQTPLRSVADGRDLIVSAELWSVPAGPVADAILVPLAAQHGNVVALLPTDRPGVTITTIQPTSRESSALVRLADVRVAPEDLLPADGSRVLDWVRTRARIALAALAVGVCEEAVSITAAYTSQRIQFGRALSTNQAVSARAADAFLDCERIRLTALKAAWHADRGEEDEARAASLISKWWASQAGLRTVHTTQHLHGGIGADISYPIHRYFLWGRQIAFTFGSAGAVLAELGDMLGQVTPIGAPA
jgi:alkylation response protein AidB-like acyl-CoA dehydrogenase